MSDASDRPESSPPSQAILRKISLNNPLPEIAELLVVRSRYYGLLIASDLEVKDPNMRNAMMLPVLGVFALHCPRRRPEAG